MVFDLPFCSEVAYAVPANPYTYPNITDLILLYDNNAQSLYKNFSYALEQIPCNTTDTAQYSLAKTCTDCANDYKTWLCAVSIPRCEDFSSTASFLRPRNVGQNFINGTSPEVADPGNPEFDAAARSMVASNQSRNPLIDQDIRPGPYKEVVPCTDLCYSMVKSCPAALGFACPLKGKGLEQSYGNRDPNGDITCSYLGAAYYLSDAGRARGPPGVFGMLVLGVLAAWWLL